MYTYSAYNKTIRSAFELPELPMIDTAVVDAEIEIRRSTVEPVPDTVEGTGGRRIVATPNAVRLTYDRVGSFLVKDGNEILCDTVDEDVENKESFRRVIENVMLGLTLYQRGYLVLHASAVSVDGNAAVFIGPRGAGKSTTAAAFDAEGYSVLEDDVVAIQFDDGVPTVIPGVPQLRLKSDAATALGVEETTTPSEDSWYDKRMLRIEDVPDPAPLRGCYLLADGKKCMLEPVSGGEQILNLVTQTYARELLSDTDQSKAHFEQCSQLTKQTPVQRLKRPRMHNQLPSAVSLVVDDLKNSDEV